MSWMSGWRQRARAILRRRHVEAEWEEELADHLEREVARNRARGMTEREARRRALIRFGGVDRVTEQVREARGARWLDDLVRDTRHGVRALTRSPGFTAVALLSFALGIGANTAIFSVVNAVLLRPLPYPRSESLFEIQVAFPSFSAAPSDADFLRLREGNETFDELGAYSVETGGFTLATAEGPRVAAGAWVTPGVLTALGVAPELGRSFGPEEAGPVALISHRLWSDVYQADPRVIGRPLLLDGNATTVVGVLPADFELPGLTDLDVWPLLDLAEPTRRGPFYLHVIGRVGPGRTFESGVANVAAVEARMREMYDEASGAWRYDLISLKSYVVGDVGQTLLILSWAVALILLIAVANVANLLLARGTVRRREVSIRAALGAGRGRLTRQLLVESTLLGVAGALIGTGIAYAGVGALRELATDILPRLREVEVDLPALLVALAAGVAAGAVTGMAPVVGLPWRRLGATMREGGGGVGEERVHGRARRALVVAELGLALSVLIGAGLLTRSLVRLQGADLGYDTGGLVTFRLSLPRDPYRNEDALGSLLADLKTHIEALPGVRSSAASMALPPNRLVMSNNYTIRGRERNPDGVQSVAPWLLVGDGFFETLEIPLLEGRAFTPQDRRDGAAVVVVSRSLARRDFPDGGAVGAQLQGGDYDPANGWATIVGVVGDVPYRGGAAGGMSPAIYLPYEQNLWWRIPFVTVRTTTPPAALVPELRRVVGELEPREPLRDVTTMEGLVRASTSTERLRSLLFTLLAGLGITLAAIGIYGVFSFDVTQSRRDMGIRIALGAHSGRVAGSLLARTLRLLALGIVLGLAGGIALGFLLRGLLYQVEPIDPVTFVATPALLALVALLACAAPCLRAVRLDPVAILKDE